ncbi:MAG: DUF3857 domain-containing protein [Bacteroidia bacterium]|nr:DUF3857 domain-containing protein [Bacteroidia bacterium]
MSKILLIFLSFLSVLSAAQDRIVPEHKNYDWAEEPKIHTLGPEEEKQGTVVLKDKLIVEYMYDKNGNPVMYLTRHKIIRLNTDKSIEENNKVYIPTGDVFEVIGLKARAVSKSGKVKMVEKENIKDVENYEDLGPFRIFAFEGIEIGSEVEYIYTLHKQPGFFGTETFQNENLRKNVEILVVSPDNLKFTSKLYNINQEPKTYDENGKNFIYVKVDSVPGLKEERYSAYRAHLQRLEYKLSRNTAKTNTEIFPFSEAATRIWEDLVDLSGSAEKESDVKSNVKRSRKAVKKFLDTLKLSKGASVEEKIRTVESRLKSYIIIKEGAPPMSLDKIFSNRYTGEKGMLRLLAETFNQMEIKFEIVLTTDRFKAFFDGEYETWNYLDHYLMYFPEIDNYLAPGEMFSRLGYIPNEWMCNDGLFVKGVKLGEIVIGSGKIKSIKCADYKLSYDNIYASILFEEDMTTTKVHLKRTLSGFSAGGLQSIYTYIPDDKKSETTDQFLKLLGEDSKLTNVNIQNMDEKSSGREPIIMECDVVTSNLIEKAGTKYIFKIGDVIGPQAELYQEDKRKLPVENEYNRGYFREITFTIPEGYTVSNLDALNFNVTCKYNDKISAEFISHYSIHGNIIKIEVEENYRDIRLPVEMFESFRKVINAAADFNKITLFLEKK